MRVIKRYANRKLYDTDARKYVTLDHIAKLVRAGEDVQVVDNVTGDDLTSVTLTQILSEKEKRQKDSVPRSLLTSVIQSGTKIKDSVVDRGGKMISGGLEKSLQALKIPTRAEFEKLQKKVARLEKKVRALQKN